jgi:endonuclease V-like protein UPF0215 family
LSPVYTVAGAQDGSFEPFRRGLDRPLQYTCLCLTRLRGPIIQDIRLACITVDGLDVTEALLKGLDSWEVDVLILGGATFAGFNVVDVKRLNGETGTPVIVFSGDRPDMEATRDALRKHFPDWRERWSRYEMLGEIRSLKIGDYPPVYYEAVGCSEGFAADVLREQAVSCRTPECVRVADLIAKGVTPVFRGPAGCSGGS